MKLISVAETLDISLSTTNENYELRVIMQRINNAIVKAALANIHNIDIYINNRYLDTIIDMLANQSHFYVKVLFGINDETCLEVKW